MARAVKTMATRAIKNERGSRATRVRVTRVVTETSPRKEGDNGHNIQLGTKAAAIARTVMATTVRAITMAARATASGAKRGTATTAMMATMTMMAMMATMATMPTMATMMPNRKEDNKNQVAMTARVTMPVARETVTGAKRAMATMATMATMGTMATMALTATMMPNSNDDASGNKGNEYTK